MSRKGEDLHANATEGPSDEEQKKDEPIAHELEKAAEDEIAASRKARGASGAGLPPTHGGTPTASAATATGSASAPAGGAGAAGEDAALETPPQKPPIIRMLICSHNSTRNKNILYAMHAAEKRLRTAGDNPQQAEFIPLMMSDDNINMARGTYTKDLTIPADPIGAIEKQLTESIPEYKTAVDAGDEAARLAIRNEFVMGFFEYNFGNDGNRRAKADEDRAPGAPTTLQEVADYFPRCFMHGITSSNLEVQKEFSELDDPAQDGAKFFDLSVGGRMVPYHLVVDTPGVADTLATTFYEKAQTAYREHFPGEELPERGEALTNAIAELGHPDAGSIEHQKQRFLMRAQLQLDLIQDGNAQQVLLNAMCNCALIDGSFDPDSANRNITGRELIAGRKEGTNYLKKISPALMSGNPVQSPTAIRRERASTPAPNPARADARTARLEKAKVKMDALTAAESGAGAASATGADATAPATPPPTTTREPDTTTGATVTRGLFARLARGLGCCSTSDATAAVDPRDTRPDEPAAGDDGTKPPSPRGGRGR